MKDVKLFNFDSEIFSKKAYEKEMKKEKKIKKEIHEKIKQKQKNEKRKRKNYEKINKKKRPLDISKHKLKASSPESKIKFKKLRVVSVRIPPKEELEKHLLKLSDEYDNRIKKIKILYNKLIYMGLTDKGFKEIKYETKKRRRKRIEKINKLNQKLIKTIESNKELEKEIEFLHKKLRK